LKAKNWTLEIQGHTDEKGSDDFNMKLSQSRADAVKNYLVSKGIVADTITAKGFGESKPIVPNDTDANREKNRRVEFKITKPNNQVITTIV
jgi:outer membrane protein OmpA-like peptidoglycan-associated protein